MVGLNEVTFADLLCQVIKVTIIHDGIVLQGEILIFVPV